MKETDQRVIVMLWKMDDEELAELCRHSKEVVAFGFHDLEDILSTTALLTEDTRYNRIAKKVAGENNDSKNTE